MRMPNGARNDEIQYTKANLTISMITKKVSKQNGSNKKKKTNNPTGNVSTAYRIFISQNKILIRIEPKDVGKLFLFTRVPHI